MSTTTDNIECFTYDIALSFAGEDRKVAAQLANGLSAAGAAVFFDEFEIAFLWGKNLHEHLAEIYSKKARFCLMVISEHYVRKAWPSHERTSAQARALESNELEYILPLRLDDTDVPGLPNTLGYLDLRELAIEKVVECALEKINSTDTSNQHHLKEATQAIFPNDPKVPQELFALPRALTSIATRKEPAWELAFFLAALKLEIEGSKHLKTDLRFGVPVKETRRLEPQDFFHWSSDYFHMIQRRIKALDKMTNGGFNELFGSGSSIGDPSPILELAQGIGRIYRQILESSLESQSLDLDPEFEKLVDLHSHLQDDAIASIERLLTDTQNTYDKWAAKPEDERGNLVGSVQISVTMPLTDAIIQESKRVARSLGWV